MERCEAFSGQRMARVGRWPVVNAAICAWFAATTSRRSPTRCFIFAMYSERSTWEDLNRARDAHPLRSGLAQFIVHRIRLREPGRGLESGLDPDLSDEEA